ncbi:MAG: carbamate kinase [Gemmatimonadota bacterium]|nr:MAG: carbamate kinase [Gemmatimonadota bacterium]
MPGKGEAVVVALGGNALAPAAENVTIFDQFRHTRESLGSVIELAREGWRVVIVHGNGPQVGDELLRNELAADVLPEQPLGVLVAATAGWIGYMIQQSLENGLRSAGLDRKVVTQVTQVVIDPEAAESREPTKFIGRALREEQAERLRAAGWDVRRDSKGILRRVVASPTPLEIVEKETIRKLIEEDVIVIAAGGGGIPVYRHPSLGLEGFDAVVDKDLAAALLGCEIGASTLLMLTDVDAVYRDFGTEHARTIGHLSLPEARALLGTRQLGRGSMRPKVEAGVRFLEAGGDRVLIAQLDKGIGALQGTAGTEITEE